MLLKGFVNDAKDEVVLSCRFFSLTGVDSDNNNNCKRSIAFYKKVIVLCFSY